MYLVLDSVAYILKCTLMDLNPGSTNLISIFRPRLSDLERARSGLSYEL